MVTPILRFREAVFPREKLASHTLLVHYCALKLHLLEAFNSDGKAPVFYLLAQAHFFGRPPSKKVVP